MLVNIVCLLQMYGARPIRRWVQKNVMTKLSEMLINGEVDKGSTVSVDATEDKKALKYEAMKMVTKKLVPLQDEEHILEVATDFDDDVADVPPTVVSRSTRTEVCCCNCHWCHGHWYHCLLSLQFFFIGFAFGFR